MSDIGAWKRSDAANSSEGWGSRAADAAATVLSLGTNKLFARGSSWLRRKGLVRYVLPALLLNEAFGAYRAYVAGGAMGLW